MTLSDVEQLVEMGFEKERAELAVQKSGGLQGAIEWLEQNQDKTMEQISAEATDAAAAEPPALKPGEEPRSLVCNECGKKFRSSAQAEYHASKTEHVDFSESTEEIAPLTEQEVKAKIEELQKKAAEKRAVLSEQDKIDKKRNEEIRRKSTKEQSDAKEALQLKQRVKEMQAKKQEQRDAVEAKKRIQARIAADKEERRLKAAQEKAAREGQPLPVPQEAIPPARSVTKTAGTYNDARLRLQTPSGTIQKSFSADTTLFEVAHVIASENGYEVQSFSLNFPKKVFEQADFGMTLREAGMVPSAAVIVK